MTLTEEELKLEALKHEQEELERKIQTLKPAGISGMVSNTVDTELDLTNPPELPKKISMGTSNYKVALLKEKLLKSPNSSLKDLKKYMLDGNGIDVSDDDLKDLIKEANINKYNELYTTKKIEGVIKKKHPMRKWESHEVESITNLLIETKYDIPTTRSKFIKNNPKSGRTSNGITLFIKKMITKMTTQNAENPQSIKSTSFKKSEKNILYPEFDKIIQMGKSITDYPEVYIKYKSASPKNIKSIKSVSDHFYHYRRKYREQNKLSSQIITHNNLSTQNPIIDNPVIEHNTHILGVKILELIRSGDISYDIIKTNKSSIRELLTIPDVKPEELKMVLEVLRP